MKITPEIYSRYINWMGGVIVAGVIFYDKLPKIWQWIDLGFCALFSIVMIVMYFILHDGKEEDDEQP